MTRSRENFSPLARLLHWTMAPLILAMLFVGVGMVATVSRAHSTLIAIHKPLGIALLVLVVIRACVRLKRGSPPLPDDIPAPQQIVAKLSHLALYALMTAMPLRDCDSVCSTSLTSVAMPRSTLPVMRCSISCGSRPVKVQTRLMTGILISGKMSVGVRSKTTGVRRMITSAITIKVYGLCSAKRTIHILFFEFL